MCMNMQEVELYGLTKNNLQDIYNNALKEIRTRVFFIDASYMYTFDLDHAKNVRDFNLLGRRYAQKLKELNIKKWNKEKVDKDEYQTAVDNNRDYCRYWHTSLEEWYAGNAVTLGDKTFRPIKISRTLDRVVNDGMEMLAGCICGEGDAVFEYRGIGDGDVTEFSVGEHDLHNLIDIINVNDTPEGGSLSRDGTTVYSIGNHSKTVETPANEEFTECGMFDSDTASKLALDLSAFDDPIPHEQNARAPGSTTVIYMCSG